MKKFYVIEKFKETIEESWKKGWHERNGGNLTYRLKDEEVEDLKEEFKKLNDWTPIGVNVENLKGSYFLVTASGGFFKNVKNNPLENIGIIEISKEGDSYRPVWGLKGTRPTSELPAHLMNHSINYKKTNGTHRVIQHSHTTNLIALTFVLPLVNERFSRELWEMATECSIVFPEGVGIVPWMVPGGIEIAKSTSNLMKKYNVVIWAHHGTFCSGKDLDLTFGLMDTVEKAAEILVKVISMGGKKQTIETENFKELEEPFKVVLNKEVLK